MKIEKVSISKLFPEMPIEIGVPDRIIMYTKQDVSDFINKWNGKTRIYMSLYSLNNPKLDKIWFDFDSEKAYDNVIKFHNWCKEHNYKHLIVMSGGGYHCTVFTKNYDEVVDPRVALNNIHRSIAQEVGLTIGNEKVFDIDHHIVGDIRRIYTIPGTFNCKRKRWAISLTEDELQLGDDEIKKLALTQRPYIYFIGDGYYDVTNFKFAKQEYHNVHIPSLQDNLVIPDDDKDVLKMFPPCIQKVLLDIDGAGNFRGRYLFTVWAKELGFSIDKTEEIAKRFFGRVQRTDGMGTNWNHYKKVKTARYIYNRDEMLPSCEKVFVDYDGICCGKCDWYIKSMREMEK